MRIPVTILIKEPTFECYTVSPGKVRRLQVTYVTMKYCLLLIWLQVTILIILSKSNTSDK